MFSRLLLLALVAPAVAELELKSGSDEVIQLGDGELPIGGVALDVRHATETTTPVAVRATGDVIYLANRSVAQLEKRVTALEESASTPTSSPAPSASSLTPYSPAAAAAAARLPAPSLLLDFAEAHGTWLYNKGYGGGRLVAHNDVLFGAMTDDGRPAVWFAYDGDHTDNDNDEPYIQGDYAYYSANPYQAQLLPNYVHSPCAGALTVSLWVKVLYLGTASPNIQHLAPPLIHADLQSDDSKRNWWLSLQPYCVDPDTGEDVQISNSMTKEDKDRMCKSGGPSVMAMGGGTCSYFGRQPQPKLDTMDGKWHFVAFTFAPSESLDVYLDGANVNGDLRVDSGHVCPSVRRRSHVHVHGHGHGHVHVGAQRLTCA